MKKMLALISSAALLFGIATMSLAQDKMSDGKMGTKTGTKATTKTGAKTGTKATTKTGTKTGTKATTKAVTKTGTKPTTKPATKSATKSKMSGDKMDKTGGKM